MARTIYTDRETEDLILERKKEDPEFNLSSWVKERLLKDYNKLEEFDIIELSNELEQLKIKEFEIQAKQEHIRQKIAQAQLKEEERIQSIEDKEKRKKELEAYEKKVKARMKRIKKQREKQGK